MFRNRGKVLGLAAIVLLTLMLALSCRYQPDVSYTYETPETWAQLFYQYWNKMNTHYMFWDLDYDQGSGWDDVYDHYMPLFEKLGNIGEYDADTEMAKNYFYTITSELSDGHYAMYLNDVDGNRLALFYPGLNRRLARLGYTEGQIYHFIMSFNGSRYTASDEEAYYPFNRYARENTRYFLEYVCKGGELYPSSGSISENISSTPLVVDPLFSELYYTLVNDSTSINVLYGKTSDHILYFGFDGFRFTSIDNSRYPEVSTLVEKFHDDLTGDNVNGVIIDLRGNGGGNVDDLNLLWSTFTPGERVYYADTRIKSGDNRLEYGAWVPAYIEADEEVSFNKDIPIIVLINGTSLSCAEFSTMFFMALRDYYGYDVTIMGDTSSGGTGYLLQGTNADMITISGITSVAPYIELIYTPAGESRYRDGRSFEGVGIPVDYSTAFDFDSFYSGTDTRLNDALEYLRRK